MPSRFETRSLPFILLLSILPFAPLAAQTPAAPPAAEDSIFTETFDVRVVNVEVFVTDAKGQRVSGLTREDFEIREDGKPVEITNFYAADGSGSAAPQVGEQSPALEEQRLQLAVYIDTTNLAAKARKGLLPSLEEFLTTRLGPDERVLFATYDGAKGLAIRPLPTANRQEISAALREAFAEAPTVPGRVAELRMLMRQIERAAAPGGSRLNMAEAEMDAGRLHEAVDSYGKRMYAESRVAIDSLDRFLNGLAGLPGRKAVLYVGGSVPLRPMQAIFESWERKFGTLTLGPQVANRMDAWSKDLSKELRRVEERANTNRITFYALADAEMVDANSAATAMYGIWSRAQEDAERGSAARALDLMTLPTGGFSELNTGDPAAMLARLRQDFDSYYSLGYTPAQRKPGGSHDIEVKVKRSGLQVRHRQSFRDRASYEVLADRTLAALYFGPADTNPLGASLQLAAGNAGAKGETVVDLTVRVPMSKLNLVPQGDVHVGRLEVAIVVRDDQGRSSHVTAFRLPVRVPAAQLQQMLVRPVAYKTQLKIRPLEHVVAVGLRDEVANVTSTVTATYKPPVPPHR
ncbi:MAG TPA: VWA domain-containing protein [Thermoanaerobaculia bacterium]|nr:VWA domain-containing protein [Thermoanaerobaculia bacterium]